MKYPDDFMNRIICGNCLEVMKKMPDNSIDLIVTSPPFKDEEVDGNYYNWLSELISEMRKISKIVLMFNSSTRLIEICKRYEPERVLIWNKKRTEQPFRYEPIFLWNNNNEKINKYIWNDCFSYLPILKQEVPYTNPTILYYNIIKMFKNANVILDPFMGSGTTAIACKQLNRNFIGIELNPEYCKIARERLRKVPKRLDNFGEAKP